jgi:hypothetical protein
MMLVVRNAGGFHRKIILSKSSMSYHKIVSLFCLHTIALILNLANLSSLKAESWAALPTYLHKYYKQREAACPFPTPSENIKITLKELHRHRKSPKGVYNLIVQCKLIMDGRDDILVSGRWSRISSEPVF